jgi:hypothetical protein
MLLIALPADRRADSDVPDGRLGSLLALVPASPSARVETVVNDYAFARARAGLTPPPVGDLRSATSYELAMTSDASGGIGCFPSPLAADPTAFAALDGDAFTASFAIAVRDGEHTGSPAARPSQSLAVAADVRPLVDALDALDVHAAVFSTDVFRFQEPTPRPNDAAAESLLPYRSVAAGVGHDGDGAFVVIALLMTDDASARVNAARLTTIATSGLDANDRRPWSDLVTVRSSSNTGPVAVLVLRTRVPLLWIGLERRPDTLVWWRAP